MGGNKAFFWVYLELDGICIFIFPWAANIPEPGLHPDGRPSNVKGIAVSIPLNSIYVNTLEGLQRIDLTTDKIVWERKFEGGCDRMAISPDGLTMYSRDRYFVLDLST